MRRKRFFMNRISRERGFWEPKYIILTWNKINDFFESRFFIKLYRVKRDQRILMFL